MGEQDRAVHQFGVVDDAVEVEHIEVVGEESRRGAPVGPPGAGRERAQGLGREAQLTGPGEDRAHLVGEAPGGQTGAQLVGPAHMAQPRAFEVDLSGEELTHRDVLLGP